MLLRTLSVFSKFVKERLEKGRARWSGLALRTPNFTPLVAHRKPALIDEVWLLEEEGSNTDLRRLDFVQQLGMAIADFEDWTSSMSIVRG